MPEMAVTFDPTKDWAVISGGQHHTLALDHDGEDALAWLYCSIR